MASATPGVKSPPPETGVVLVLRCLNFNPFNISGGWDGAVGGSGCVWAAVLRRILSLFLNDAWIYSEDAVLWDGVADMSLPCCFIDYRILYNGSDCVQYKITWDFYFKKSSQLLKGIRRWEWTRIV